jgi:hypothetical protein
MGKTERNIAICNILVSWSSHLLDSHLPGALELADQTIGRNTPRVARPPNAMKARRYSADFAALDAGQRVSS